MRRAPALAVGLAAVIAMAGASARRGGAQPADCEAATKRTERVTLDARTREAATRLIGAAFSSDHAWQRLSQLCDGIGHRLSGSSELERAVTWAAAAMREDGLERVRLQPVMVPHWVRGQERAVLVEPGPHALTMLGLGRSVGTPAGGLTADVVVVGSFAELDSLPADAVRGRIVLFDVPFKSYSETVRYRADGPHRAAARGAVAALVRSVGPVSLRTPHTGAMAPYVDSIPKIPAAAVTIEDAERMRRLAARGERVRVRLEMGALTLPDALSHNVIGEIRGRERPDQVVVVGGHIDSWDVGAGAQDDGGGCVIAMEALRLIKQSGSRPRRTVRCVLWTNEENGVKGGQAYADSLAGRKERHVAAIESDGGVERPVGFSVAINQAGTDSADAAATARAVERVREIGRLLEGLGAAGVEAGRGDTDTKPLLKQGVPCLSHRTVMEHYFDWHHTPADMLDKVDPLELRRNAAALAVMVYVLAEMPETLTTPPTGSTRR